MKALTVYLAGASGNVGKELVRALVTAPDLTLVGGWCRRAGLDLGVAAGVAPNGVLSSDDLLSSLRETSPDVVVDFTAPDVVMSNLQAYYSLRLDAVVGTTGINAERLVQARQWAADGQLRWALIANFSLSMNLSVGFLQSIRQHYPYITIVERHSANKADAPSGTSQWLARSLADGSTGEVKSMESLDGALGASVEGVRILSQRLPIPGAYSEHEVLLGRRDELLSLKVVELSSAVHSDGVLLALRNLSGLAPGTVATELRDLMALNKEPS